MLELNDLIIKINTETSILFLGQEYEKGLYVAELKKLLPDSIIKKIFVNEEFLLYSNLIDSIIDYCEEEPHQQEVVLDCMIRAEETIADNRFTLLSSMGWCGVVTSLMNQLPGFSDLRLVLSRLDIKNDYFSRKKPYITYLFGKAGSDKVSIPITYENKMAALARKNEFWSKITTRLKMSGVLVIDGWNPQNDWITDDDLNTFITFPENSIYFFSVTEYIKSLKSIKKLVSKKIVNLYDENLYDVLCKSGYETFGSLQSDDNTEVSGVEITIDSVNDKMDSSIQYLSYQTINQLDASVNILDNTILDNPDYINREEYFMRFLSTENGVPLWGGYASGFYFRRDIDDELFEKVEKQLRNTDPAKSHVVLLEGSNSSGKTTTLGNLAYRIRIKKKYPVVYITSRMKEEEQYEDLERLIKNHINAKMGARKTVIIWDKNTYAKDDVYENMRKNLEECNVVIVGSRYIVNDKSVESNDNFETVSLDDYLHEATELIALRQSLKTISTRCADNFEQIVKKIKCVSDQAREPEYMYKFNSYSNKGNWFLLIFYRLFEELHDIQKRSVRNEASLAQESFVKLLKDYSLKKFNEGTFSKMYEILGFNRPDNTGYYTEKVSEIFNMIAVAGKYGLELPAMVVYRAYKSLVGDWQNFIQNIERNSVIDINLHEDGIMMIYFRRALEASLFLEQQAASYEELLELEVNSLLLVIRNTNFYDMDGVDSEALQIVNLIRRFGPNGPEPTRYKKYFYKIAEVINEVNSEVNDEAILVASHMVREAFCGDPRDNSENVILLNARTRLRKAINKYGNKTKSQQLVRLKVEISANLLKSIPNEGCITEIEREIFNELEMHLESVMEINITRFSVGVFLDALLRVYDIENNNRIKAKILSRMLQIVDTVNDSQFTIFGDNIHNKILTVLSYAQKYSEIEEENKKLLEEGSDVGIYRQVMKILKDYSPITTPNEDEKIRILAAIKILEENFQIVRNKPRSLYLYIRLLWIEFTGFPPFTEKQFIALDNERWRKLSNLCELYIGNEESQKKPFPYFILEMYNFNNGSIKPFKEVTEITREFRNHYSAYVTYAIMCDEYGNPIKENIELKRSTNRRSEYSAVFNNIKYQGIEAYFKDSNFKEIIDISDGRKIKSALIGFNLYGLVVYGENDLYSQIGGRK
ncbi:hypothetical protein [Clostridium sp. BNL1100]|uniref:P-loop NTPase n=1 Tax=Clostridium sp. BNL1100 TaxID=755731 RepID=UPI00024A7B81|nr:hypothetical protein [Clostridium sp. BNL1100]AEY65739.1 hypothetical protein Clo1100_1508 [Clostridium sp. BNL1100]